MPQSSSGGWPTDYGFMQRLTQAAERCLGIDIDRNAVDQVKALTGFDNVIAADVTQAGNRRHCVVSVGYRPFWRCS